MTIAITDFLTRIATDLNEEDNDFPSLAWTRTEMLAYLNNAERDFLRLTGMVQTDVNVSADGSTILFNRPDNTMDLNRVSFNGKNLRRQTSNDFMMEDRNWRNNAVGKPSYWHEDHLAVTQFELNKIPAAGGTIRIFADYLYDEYASVFEDLHLRDIWEPYLRWKVLSLALAKDGENQDLGRSSYAQERYMVGVRLALRLIKEDSAIQI